MAHKRKDTTVAPKERVKHFRPFLKRKYNKATRRLLREALGKGLIGVGFFRE